MKKSRSLQNKLVASTLAAAIFGILAQGAYSQSADATLRGRATANTEITAKNTATGLVRHVKASADGSYSVIGLPPGTYLVETSDGTKKTVTLSVASTATVDLVASAVAAPEGALEEIMVRSNRPVEVRTSEVGESISLHQIETIPQISRNFLEFADTVPGMSFQVDSNGKNSLHSGTQDTSSINVYIDGVGQKNYVRQGGISGQAGSNKGDSRTIGDAGNPFPQLAIGEYKVITSNYKAEYDQISGAAITAETKSGTNEFHGEIFGDFTNSSLRAAVPQELAVGGAKVSGPSKEYGLGFGGPIIEDKLHFFLTYEGKRFTTPNVVTPPILFDNSGNPLLPNPVPLLPASLLAQYGTVANNFNEDLYFGKIDWEFSDRDRVEFSTKIRQESEINGAGVQVAKSAAFNYLNNDYRAQLHWQHSGEHWLNDALVTYENTKDTTSALGSSNGVGIVYVYQDLPPLKGYHPLLQINGQGPNGYYQETQKGTGFQDDLTFSDIEWAGEHTLKTGFKYKGVTLSARDASAAALYQYYVVPKAYAPGLPTGIDPNPFQVEFRQATGDGSVTAVSKNQQFGVYFQDDWAVNHQLTLNLGVRYDYENTPSYTGYVTPAAVRAALNRQDPNTAPPNNAPIGQTYAQSLAMGPEPIHISDYYSNGHNRKNPGNEFQPRLGFSFDIDDDQRHVVFGGIGRAYDRNVFDSMQKETTVAALSPVRLQFQTPYGEQPFLGCKPGDPITSTCLNWDPKYLTAAGLQSYALGGIGEADLLNNHLKAPHSDQFSIGVRNKLGDWNTSATIARINGHDGLVGHSGQRNPDGSWYNGSNYGFSPDGLGSLVLWDNGRETRNTELLFSADKPYTKESGWGANVAYTFQRATENVYYSQIYMFDYPRLSDISFHDSPAVPRHRLVLTGAADGPWGVVLGAKLTLETVTPYFSPFGGWNCPNNPPATRHTPPPDGSGSCVAPTPFDSQYFYNSTYIKGQHFLFGGTNFGYRDIDLQVTKNIDLPHGATLQMRFDALNVINFVNTDSQNGVLYPWPKTPYRDPNGAIVGVPRTFKFTVNLKF